MPSIYYYQFVIPKLYLAMAGICLAYLIVHGICSAPGEQISTPGQQMAREKQLRPDQPTLFKRNIGGFPHRVRIWGDSEHKLLPK